MESIAELIKLMGVGLVSGLFSSWIANKDHRQRKWWELRVSAYQNAIEALSDVIYYYECYMAAEVASREISDETAELLSKKCAESFSKLRKYADSGAFIFSDNVSESLKRFIEPYDAINYFDHLDTNLFFAKKCLKEIVECSKVDLALKSDWFKNLRKWNEYSDKK